MIDTKVGGGQPFYNLETIEHGGFLHTPATSFTAPLTAGHTAIYTSHGGDGDAVDCQIGLGPQGVSYTGNVDQHDGTGINFAVWGARAAFRYLIVID